VVQLMRISELAQAAGVSKRTVDFYTNLGLIVPAQRTEGGYRLYAPDTVDVIATIRKLEASGMALDEIGKDLTTVTAADLTQIVGKLSHELEALRSLAETNGSSAHGMATTLAVRAHNLLVMATELLIAVPDV
jgi:DNA-binding transcriptional MerR regulator